MALGEVRIPASGLIMEQRRSVFEELPTAEKEAAKKILIQATDRQITAVNSGRFQKYAESINSHEYFETYLQDPHFLNIYQLAQQEALVIESDEQFIQYFKGAMFQDLTYLILSSLDGKIILPEQDVFEIVKALNPGLPVARFPFDGRGIEHRYIPDGLVVNATGKQPKITNILEYSLSQSKPRSGNQRHGFHCLSSALGDMASQPTFVNVCPVPDNNLIFEKPGVNKLLMPFRVGEFIDDFLYNQVYFGNIDGEKTLADLRNERKTQLSSSESSLSAGKFF